MITLNPLMDLPSAKRIANLPNDAKKALDDLFGELSDYAERMAEHSWRRHEGTMAAYWQAVAVYARHTRHLCRTEYKMCRCGEWFVGLPLESDCQVCRAWHRIRSTLAKLKEVG